MLRFPQNNGGSDEISGSEFWYLPVAMGVGAIIDYCVHGFREHPPVQSSDLAAWVQAIGSVGAILGAVWISHSEARNRAKNWRDESLKMIDIAIHIGHHAYSTIGSLDDYRCDPATRETPATRNFYYEDLTRTFDACSALPLHLLPNSEVVEQVLVIKKQLSLALSKVHEIPCTETVTMTGSDIYGKKLRPYWNNIREALQLLRDERNDISKGRIRH